MKHLYQKIYLTIIASLLLSVIVSGAMWRFGPGNDRNPPGFEITKELVAIALPSANLPKQQQAQGTLKLARRLKIDMALYDASLNLIATTSTSLPMPDVRSKGTLHWRRNMIWSFQIADRRWVVARSQHHFGRGSPLGLLWFLGSIALVIGLCAYPVVRGLTRRLERLQTGVVTLGTGDLKARVDVRGKDEIAQLATSFNASAAQIETLFNAHRQLLANASHELRTPLARIRLGLELLKENPSAQRHEELERDISELDQMIDEILLASRLEAVEELETVEEIDLLALAAEECNRYDDCALHGEPAFVNGDPRLLRRLIRNLLDNATRHGKPPIEVEITLTNTNVTLCVTDHGPGIPDEARETIFKPFYRLSGSQNKPGSGLGLSLVKQIAKHHGGDAQIIADDDKLSRIQVVLPRAL